MTDVKNSKCEPVSTPDNITSFKEARQKKEKSKKLNAGEVCKLLADVIAHSPKSWLPDFPKTFGVFEPKPGVNVPLLINEDQSIVIVEPKAIADELLRYCDTKLWGRPEFALKPKQAKEVAEYFLAVHPPIQAKDIKYTRWLDEPGYTYRRLPWAKADGPTPTWDTLLRKMSNSTAFIEWIGSLFFEEAYLHNYVWIFGEGGDGKGAINRFLAKVLGNEAYRSKTAPTVGKNGTVDKFWAYNLIGARLAVFADCENATFTTSGFFKSLTGGDPIEVEAKNFMGFTVYLNTRYMILANVKPAITSAKSDLRRIIYCEMEPNENIQPGSEIAFEEALWNEGGYFISKCVENYISMYPTHGQIKSDQGSLENVIDENEQHLENFFEKYFRLEPTGNVLAKDIKVAAEEAWPRQRKTYREFLMWLKRVHKISCKVERVDAQTTGRFYEGMVRRIVVQNKDNFSPEHE